MIRRSHQPEQEPEKLTTQEKNLCCETEEFGDMNKEINIEEHLVAQ